VALACFLAIALLSIVPRPVAAHPEGFSGLQVIIQSDRVRAVLTLHTRDMSNWFPPLKYPDYVADVSREMRTHPLDLLDMKLDDVSVPPIDCKTSSPEVGMIEVDIDYPMGQPASWLTVWSKHLGWFPRDHQQLLTVEDHRAGAGPVKGVRLLRQSSLTSEENAAEVEIPQVAAPAVAPPLDAAATASSPAPSWRVACIAATIVAVLAITWILLRRRLRRRLTAGTAAAILFFGGIWVGQSQRTRLDFALSSNRADTVKHFLVQ
jgi:hypothetical protein